MNREKKLTAKSIGFTQPFLMNLIKEEIGGPDGPQIPLYRVYGEATDIEEGTGTYGKWVKFHGKFECTVIHSNDKYNQNDKVRAREVMLPDIGGDELLDALFQAKQDDPNAAIQFGIDVSVSYMAHASGDKYKFEVKTLGDSADLNDSLTQLGNSLGALPKLPAPKKSKK